MPFFRTSSLRARGAADPAPASPVQSRRARTMPTSTDNHMNDEIGDFYAAYPNDVHKDKAIAIASGEASDGTDDLIKDAEKRTGGTGAKFPADAAYAPGVQKNSELAGDEGDSAGDATSDGTDDEHPSEILNDTLNNTLLSDDNSDAASEASMLVLMRYMGCSSKPYMGRKRLKDSSTKRGLEVGDLQYKHDLQEGDHVIQWKMLGYCYPIQSHGIVFSAGPDFVTIVDCSMAYNSDADKAGNFDENTKKKKTRRRMNILTLDDEKEIKKWTKIRYGEEVQLKVHSTNKAMQKQAGKEKDAAGKTGKDESSADAEESPSVAGLEMEEVERCVQAKIKTSPEKSSAKSPQRSPSSWFSWSTRSVNSLPPADADAAKAGDEGKEKQQPQKEELRLPKSDPPALVLARLRFLLEYGEGPFSPPGGEDGDGDKKSKDRDGKPRPNLLPPHHLLYANSECIAVWCQTGRWSTLQAAIFLHSSTVGNAKQTATLGLGLGAKTVAVPASGLWGFFGGTTTVSLFTAQPWIVPALVGGGMVYIGLPMLMLWKAKGRWLEAERRLNDAFWSMPDSDVIVELIRCWSGLEG
ncbi:hypothetical protein ACHAXT_013257 [Thalassiosira profunda]